MNTISDERLKKYFQIAEKALKKAKKSKQKISLEVLNKSREDFIDMIERYIEDAKHFHKKGEDVNAFAALNYAHGFLDAGARLGIFDVHDSKLFAQD